MARYADGSTDRWSEGSHGTRKEMGLPTALAVIIGGCAGIMVVARILGIG